MWVFIKNTCIVQYIYFKSRSVGVPNRLCLKTGKQIKIIYTFVKCLGFFFFWDESYLSWLCQPACPWIHAYQPAFASQWLGLLVCAGMLSNIHFWKWLYGHQSQIPEVTFNRYYIVLIFQCSFSCMLLHFVLIF